MRIGAVILTGGRGKRIGTAKEWLPFAGTTLLARVTRSLAACCSPIVVVARDAEQSLPELPSGTAVTWDAATGGGPLMGLATGLRWLRDHAQFAATDAAFVTGCDLPFITGDVVTWLAARMHQHSVVMPRVGDMLQPLCALYRIDALLQAEALLAQGLRTPRSMAQIDAARIVTAAEFAAIDPDGRLLHNINTSADYDAARTETDDV